MSDAFSYYNRKAARTEFASELGLEQAIEDVNQNSLAVGSSWHVVIHSLAVFHEL